MKVPDGTPEDPQWSAMIEELRQVQEIDRLRSRVAELEEQLAEARALPERIAQRLELLAAQNLGMNTRWDQGHRDGFRQAARIVREAAGVEG
jgi:hypothetical protein